jgi:hypothetical protein
MTSKKKSKPLEIVTTEVTLPKSQIEWLEKKKFNLSRLVNDYLKEFIASMEKTKSVAIPAYIKAADDETIKARLRKNPKLRHLVEKGK